MKILVVDDDAICRTLIAKGLENAGYDTELATEARQALEVLQSDGAISLLITDVMMPEIDGFGLLDSCSPSPADCVHKLVRFYAARPSAGAGWTHLEAR
jgi:CheY-like chemotaxis protein